MDRHRCRTQRHEALGRLAIALLALPLLVSCEPAPSGDTGYLRLEGGEDWFVLW